jgi:glutamyl-tRNA reductase
VSTTADGAGAILLVVGLSRETAPVHVRERASLDAPAASRLLRALRALRASGACGEALALSTCNRTEVYAAVAASRAADAPTVIRETLACRTSISREELVQLGYVRFETDATEHLFGVVSGLNSTVLGEPEIVAQARAAVALARSEGMLGRLLEGLFSHAVAAGRRVRAGTAIARGATSVSSVAVDLAEMLLEDLAGRSAVVIGAGKVACAVTQRLAAAGVSRIVVANRSEPAAAALAAQAGGRAVSLGALPDELRAADLVVCATGAPSPVVSRRMLAAATRGREERLVVLDLAVPRDVEPVAHDVPGVVLRDIDEIQRIAAANLDDRRRELPRAWSIVRAEAGRYQAWRAGLEAEPLVTELRRRAEEIRRRELERLIARSPDLGDAELMRLDTITRVLMKKILHEPTRRIRGAGANVASRAQLEALCDLFGVEAAREDGVEAAREDGVEAAGEDGVEAAREHGVEAAGEHRAVGVHPVALAPAPPPRAAA